MGKFVVQVPEIHMQPYVVEGETIETPEDAYEAMTGPGDPQNVSIEYDKSQMYFRRTMEPEEHRYEVDDPESEKTVLVED